MTLEEAYQRIAEAERTGARELNLAGCRELRDVNVLAKLSGLQTLHLSWCSELRDVNGLAKLTGLQTLYLSECRELRDVNGLAKLTGLQTLYLSDCSELRDVNGLAKLSGLQTLVLFGCRRLRDVSVLGKLSGLQTLALFGCSELRDVKGLGKLSGLQTLDLSGCSELRDVKGLGKLSGLQTLSLSRCSEFGDVKGLAKLSGLQTLDLSDCSELRDVNGLGKLSGLQTLDLRSIAQIPLPQWIVSHPALKDLTADTFIDVPAEVQSQTWDDNCLHRLRAWWADGAADGVTEPEVKVFVLGNGGVGKTQLCRFLKNEAYDESVKTTHGVQLIRCVQGAEPVRAGAHLNVWDFGGQDIYHGTHSLFLKSAAVFVILWTPESETRALAWKPGEAEEAGGAYVDRPRPLAYWLHYVRELAGAESPVLLVQSQCEERRQIQAPDGTLAEMLPVLPPLSFSARTRYGGETLLGALRDAVAELHRAHPPHTYGQGWIAVRDRCHQMRAEGVRTMTREEFDRLCAETGGVSDSGVLLEVLHRAGVVFHREGLFGGQIIVDQGWALEAIYTVFHRERCVPELRGPEGFTRKKLDRLAWGEVRRREGLEAFTEEEQELFLSMMVSCGICFPWKWTAEGERVYLAPELLLPREAVREYLAGRLRKSDLPRRTVTFRYRFLHEGVVRELLSTVGQKAQDAAVYWRNGLWLYEAKTDAYAVIEAHETPERGLGAGELELALYGERSAELGEMLRGVVQRLAHRPTEVVGVEVKGEAGPRMTDEGGGLEQADFQRKEEPPRGAPRAIFISYAWGDDTAAGKKRTAAVELLCARLDKEGYQVVRDNRSAKVGDSIGEFVKRFGRADRVVAIVSDKYLRSIWCMWELHTLWLTSQQERARFQGRVHPLVLEDAKIGKTLDRLERVKFWREEYEGLLAAQKELADSFGVEDQRELKLIGSFAREVSDMLRWLNDEVMPHEFEKDEDLDGLMEFLGRE